MNVTTLHAQITSCITYVSERYKATIVKDAVVVSDASSKYSLVFSHNGTNLEYIDNNSHKASPIYKGELDKVVLSLLFNHSKQLMLQQQQDVNDYWKEREEDLDQKLYTRSKELEEYDWQEADEAVMSLQSEVHSLNEQLANLTLDYEAKNAECNEYLEYLTYSNNWEDFDQFISK